MLPWINGPRASLMAASALVLLSGCTTVGPNFRSPEAQADVGYAMAGDAVPAGAATGGAAVAPSAAGTWWSAFGSADLDRTIALALAQNPSVSAAQARLAAAAEAYVEAQGQSRPKAELSSGIDRQRVNLQSFGFSGFGGQTLSNPTFTLYSVGASLDQDLDLFGGGRRRTEAAKARTERQARQADAVSLSLSANIAQQAVTIAALDAQIAATRQMLGADQDSVTLLARGTAIGAVTKTAALTASQQLEKDQALLGPLQTRRATARHALAGLVGQAPGNWTAPDFTLAGLTLSAPVPVALPSQLVRQRPDILAAEADLHAATADVGVATAALYPRISLTGSFAQGATSGSNLFSYDSSGWNFGAGLTAPVFQRGQLKARRRAMEAKAKEADAAYRQTVLTAFIQVSDALQALASDEGTLASRQRAQEQADETVRLAKAAHDQGGGTLLTLADARRKQAEAASNLAQAQAQRLSDAIALFAATGADWRGVQ
jgi:NodT family efflux transporter outer membrane factor (OMF) lipoprotein